MQSQVVRSPIPIQNPHIFHSYELSSSPSKKTDYSSDNSDREFYDTMEIPDATMEPLAETIEDELVAIPKGNTVENPRMNLDSAPDNIHPQNFFQSASEAAEVASMDGFKVPQLHPGKEEVDSVSDSFSRQSLNGSEPIWTLREALESTRKQCYEGSQGYCTTSTETTSNNPTDDELEPELLGKQKEPARDLLAPLPVISEQAQGQPSQVSPDNSPTTQVQPTAPSISPVVATPSVPPVAADPTSIPLDLVEKRESESESDQKAIIQENPESFVEEVAFDPPTKDPLATKVEQEEGEEDEFDDFAAPVAHGQEDDEFGDFGESPQMPPSFPPITTTTTSPVPAPVPASSIHVPESNKPCFAFAKKLSEVESTNKVAQWNIAKDWLHEMLPLKEMAPSLPTNIPAPLVAIEEEEDVGSSSRSMEDRNANVHVAYRTEPWYALLESLCPVTPNEECESPKRPTFFRWNKSFIRKKFLTALELPINIDELYAASKQRQKAGQNRFLSEDKADLDGTNIEFDTKAALAFVEVSQEELNNKTTEELAEMNSKMNKSIQHALSHIAYWLDQREQLSVDAAMRNSMISDLIQNAGIALGSAPKSKFSLPRRKKKTPSKSSSQEFTT